MKHTWKTRLSALLLSAVMLVSLTPAALAAPSGHTHDWQKEWTRSSERHWHACSGCDERRDEAPHDFVETERVEPTCSRDGRVTETCTVCGYTTDTILPATGAHEFSAAWSGDNTHHWHACKNADQGCRAVDGKAEHTPVDIGRMVLPTCTEGGYTVYTCEVCGREYTAHKVPPKGHHFVDGVCTECGAVDQSRVTVVFKNGDEVHNVQELRSGGRPQRPADPERFASNRTYTFRGWVQGSDSKGIYTGQPLVEVSTVSLTKTTTYSAVYTVKAVRQNAEAEAEKQPAPVGRNLYAAINGRVRSVTGTDFDRVVFSDLVSSGYGRLYTDSSKGKQVSAGTAYRASAVNDFYFVPGSREGYTIGYTAEAGQNTVSGTITFRLKAAAQTIRQPVDAGDALYFDLDWFRDALAQQTGGTLRYVMLETQDELTESTGMVYYDYQGHDQKGFSRSRLDDYKFYYNSPNYGDYPLGGLCFAAPESAASRTVTLSFRAYNSAGEYASGTLELQLKGGAVSETLRLRVAPGSSVPFDSDAFVRAYQKHHRDTPKYVTFSTGDTLSSSAGAVYYRYGHSDEERFSASGLRDQRFYLSSSRYGDYPLSGLSFAAPESAAPRTVTLSFRACESSSRYVSGKLIIEITRSENRGTLTYDAAPGGQVLLGRERFNQFYQKAEKTSKDIRYVVFYPTDSLSAAGTFFHDLGGREERSFTKASLERSRFYFSSASYGDFPLSKLSFAAADRFAKPVELRFRACYSSSDYAQGTLVLRPSGTQPDASRGDLFYYAEAGTNVQLKASEFARYLDRVQPGSRLRYVDLTGVPSQGGLYYNYYGASAYGPTKLHLTAETISSPRFFFSPASKTQYALSELTYVPSGSNYCASIAFRAVGTDGRSAAGTVLISVNRKAMPEVYGVTLKGRAVVVPDAAIYNAVAGASGLAVHSIRFLSLPGPSVGTMYANGTRTRADTKTRYTYAGTVNRMDQLRFVPASAFTGSVELPYIAYSSSGAAIAAGQLSLGVVSRLAGYKDMSPSTWCYKYVVELSDAGVISGYKDNTYQETRNVSYGEALKLVLLAAGYDVQKPTGSHWASGYLSKARAEGVISGKVDLDARITRLALARIAAKAMKLDTTHLSGIRPFTDTSDIYVQALNEAGIVEGYFHNGTSTFKPNNQLTRGHIAAIIWRMERAAR